jgi:hypothetical protein
VSLVQECRDGSSTYSFFDEATRRHCRPPRGRPAPEASETPRRLGALREALRRRAAGDEPDTPSPRIAISPYRRLAPVTGLSRRATRSPRLRLISMSRGTDNSRERKLGVRHDSSPCTSRRIFSNSLTCTLYVRYRTLALSRIILLRGRIPPGSPSDSIDPAEHRRRPLDRRLQAIGFAPIHGLRTGPSRPTG